MRAVYRIFWLNLNFTVALKSCNITSDKIYGEALKMHRIFVTLAVFVLLATSLHAQLYVNNSLWRVEDAINGRNGDYHPVPWAFLPNGKVYAGDLWHGTWFKRSGDTIRVVIIFHQNSLTDAFDVKFDSPTDFTAYKYGQAYRYGKKTDETPAKEA